MLQNSLLWESTIFFTIFIVKLAICYFGGLGRYASLAPWTPPLIGVLPEIKSKSMVSPVGNNNLEGNITIRGSCDNAHVTSLYKQLLDPLPEAQGQWHGAHGRRSGCFYICLWLKQCELHVPPSLSLFHRSNPMLMHYTIVLNIMTINERRCLIAHGHQINCA